MLNSMRVKEIARLCSVKHLESATVSVNVALDQSGDYVRRSRVLRNYPEFDHKETPVIAFSFTRSNEDTPNNFREKKKESLESDAKVLGFSQISSFPVTR